MARRENRYKKLCEAFDIGIKECRDYQQECRDFVHELKNSIVESLGCPETKVYMFPPSTGFIPEGGHLHGDEFDTEFGENGTAAIGFAINVNGKSLEEKFFTFLIVFKKSGANITFNVDDNKDFKNTPDGVKEFCDYLFKEAEKNLLGRLKNFLLSPEEASKPIGFRMASEVTNTKIKK